MRGAVVVRLTAAVLASVAVISGFVNLTRFTDADQLPSAAINDLRADRRDVTALRFLVTATGLNPEEHTLHAAVSFVPTMNDPKFVDLENRPIVDPATAKLRPEFTDLALSITVDNMWVGGVTVPYPLAAVLESAPLLGNPAVNVAIPADVDPDSFPNDTYAFDLSLYVQLPPGVFADDPPVMVGTAADSRLGQWHLDADRVAWVQFSAIEMDGAGHAPPTSGAARRCVLRMPRRDTGDPDQARLNST